MRKLLVSLAACIGLLAICGSFAVVASAEKLGHTFDTTIAGSGTNAIGSANSVEADSSSGPSQGDIYVADGGKHRVEKFAPNGAFILMFGSEVNQTTHGNICTAASGDTCKEGEVGSGAQNLTNPEYITVDSSSGPSAGDVYVSEGATRTVRKYDENGNLITSWGVGGSLTGSTTPLGPFSQVGGVDTDGSGNLFVFNAGGRTFKFDQAGTYLSNIESCRGDANAGVGVSPDGTIIYKIDGSPELQRITTSGLCGDIYGKSQVSGIGVDPVTGTFYGSAGGYPTGKFLLEYAVNGSGAPLDGNGIACPQSVLESSFGSGCAPTHEFGSGDLVSAKGIGVASQSSKVYVADGSRVQVFKPLEIPKATTGEPISIEESSATVSGSVDPDGAGTITECYVEYGPSQTYGASAPCNPAGPYASTTTVEAELTNLTSGHEYHYRVVAVNSSGAGRGEDHTLKTSGPPSINFVTTSDLTATSAVLHTQIVPNSVDTTYHFEYGTSTTYGTDIPIPDEDIGAGTAPVDLSKTITGLQHATYHFRVVATNALGTSVSEDQTFNFFPPDCPNRTVRQATGSDYLPDCRAYELVSPGDAGNVIFPAETEEPVATYATSPARLAFGGTSGQVNGTEPPNSLTDMYVATRGGTGWTTKFVGLKGHEAQSNCSTIGNLKLSVFLSFRCEYFIYQGATQPPQNAPFVWDSQGNSLGRWPVSLPLIPEGDSLIGSFQPSPDFSHMAFSSNNVAFAPNGQTSGIGSAYDYNSQTGETQIISRLQNGADIPEEPAQVGNKKDYLLFPGVHNTPNLYAYDGKPTNSLHPGVSTEGSHILMGARSDATEHPLLTLYMRVDDAVTYEVSEGHGVKYVGMTNDGKKVFFISSAKLTADDTDNSADLYMWSAEKAENEEPALTRISVGEGEAGNQDNCNVTWATGCGVAMPEATNAMFSSSERAEIVNNVDNVISGVSGDIYFYSPERLVGVDAAPNERNLYVYRNGQVQFVAAAEVNRIETTPNDSKMAMVTASRVTAYNSGGKREMYTYDPESAILRCLSCPTESSPTGNVEGSLNGQYITEDGRVFFYSPDALVPYDTNHLGDVYEFVDGRPQLITTGTASQENPKIGNAGYERLSGLIGVSADGVNAYFATYDTLVPQDHNGQYIKFYDARAGGGFPEETPLQPCAAADECHGPGSEPPSPPPISSENNLGDTGNAKRSKPKAKKKHKKQKRHHRAHRAHGRAGR